MILLLYFVSFAEMLVLLVSSTMLAGWMLLKLLDGFVRIYLRITRPEMRPAKKPTWDYDPNILKRAGQW